MRLEIIRPDQDEIIGYLWDALEPLFDKTKGRIMVYMTSDGGEKGNERAMVLTIKNLSNDEVYLS